jgi:heme oxygenase
MRNNQSKDLEFGTGTITTRSFLIAEKFSEINKKSYLANGSKFQNNAPLCYQKDFNRNYKINLGVVLRDSLRTLNNEGVRVISNTEESWNESNKIWRKGDIKVIGKRVFKCISDETNSTNFNDLNCWREIYDFI